MLVTIEPTDERYIQAPEGLREFVEYMNELLTIDRSAISRLFAYRVGCVPELEMHGNVQVATDERGKLTVAPIGIIGGFFNEGIYRFGVNIEDDDTIVSFIIVADIVS